MLSPRAWGGRERREQRTFTFKEYFTGGSDGKESTGYVGDPGLISGL